MKKFLTLTMVLAMLLTLLTGCGCSHEWAEATCEAPKTCTLCGEIEGEALGHSFGEATCAAPSTCAACGATQGEALPHTLTEANFQEAPVCTVCGAVEGEPLTPGFVEMGIPVREAEVGAANTLTIHGSRYSYTVVSHEIMEPDEDHPALEGYVWHSIKTHLEALENQASLGTNLYAYTDFADYYDPISQTDSVALVESNAFISMSFTCNYLGQDYTDCLMRLDDAHLDCTGGAWTYDEEITFRIPEGYDGIMIAIGDSDKMQGGTYGEMWESLYSDENTLLFRIQ